MKEKGIKDKKNGNIRRKITIFIYSLSGGGAERVGCNLANYIFDHGYDVDVITMSNKNDSYKLRVGIRRICLLDEKERKNKLYNILLKRRRLRKYVIENKDVSCYIPFLPFNIFLLMGLKHLINGKIIITERNNPLSYNIIEKLIMNYSAKRCDGLVVQTNEIGEYYKDIREKIVIPNAINDDVILPERHLVRKRIVAVGRLTQQKNYPVAIKAFLIFNKKHPDYVLEIFGQGKQEGLIKDLVGQYGLSDKVIFRGYVKNVSEQIADAACFIMSSDYEGIPNALIEAMCLGLPCVVTDCDGGGAKSLITNGENGILVAKGSSTEMALGMCKVIECKKTRDKISRNAKKIRSELEPKKVYGQWLKYVERISK